MPNAYLNYLLFDTAYQLLDQGFIKVSQAAKITVGGKEATREALAAASASSEAPNTAPAVQGEELNLEIAVASGGILYAYVSNESNWDAPVMFDNFTVQQTTLVPEVVDRQDYYSFGLTHQQPLPGQLKNRYLFNGKELTNDFELGIYDFGARIYDPILGKTWQLDPKADKYHAYSSYSWALNNPISIIDPTGMSAFPGDFYNENGKKVGSDGKDDGKSYLVTDKSEAKSIAQTDKQGRTTDVSNVKSAVELPSKAALKESLNVLGRAEDNGGLKEESSLVMKDGTIVEGKTGEVPVIENGYQTARSSLPDLPEGTSTSDVEAAIHSHPIEVQIENDLAYPQTATNPSAADRMTSSHKYKTNIIVGNLSQPSVSQDSNGNYKVSKVAKGAVIYNSRMKPKAQLTRQALKRIIK